MIPTTHALIRKLLLLLILLFNALVTFSQDDLIIDGIPCNIHGSSRPGSLEYDQNIYKNRYTIPTVSSFDNTIALKDLIDGSALESKFSENKAAKISGYVFNVKVGGTESCNCKTTDEAFKDTHIELTPDNTHIDPEYRMIVEITPRMRQIMEKQGVDWSTSTLKDKLKGHLVTVEGWLFYDKSHEPQAFATNPENTSGRNWRAACWEIHPITKIDVLDPSDDMEMLAAPDNRSSMPTDIATPPNHQPNSPSKSSPMEPANTPLNTLIIILIGAILGAVGQGIRVIVGVKKVNDNAVKTNTAVSDAMDYRQMAFSLVIAFAVGGVAGVLAAVTTDNIQFTKSTIIAFITAGYAGTDFIEGFIKKYPNVQNANADKKNGEA